eukprot:5903469-Prymnesium_polylepis.2
MGYAPGVTLYFAEDWGSGKLQSWDGNEVHIHDDTSPPHNDVAYTKPAPSSGSGRARHLLVCAGAVGIQRPPWDWQLGVAPLRPARRSADRLCWSDVRHVHVFILRRRPVYGARLPPAVADANEGLLAHLFGASSMHE